MLANSEVTNFEIVQFLNSILNVPTLSIDSLTTEGGDKKFVGTIPGAEEYKYVFNSGLDTYGIISHNENK